ncbi:MULTISPECIES: DNA topoisomerase IB [Microbacterium]|uniref:DNA topoisomerase IB n=1 Tax=Microbacterium TaxID=33882 RepID=UPI001E4B6110|nr:DNA topoisomerase IB [Microbacterium nymphoidis]MCD2499107.1 DNA topoisomerase IB [Microbacterium nymphoidis]
MTERVGWRRIRRGRGFEYRDESGHRITDEVDLSRIRALAIPPMWRDVWISPDPDADLQVTGVDAAGRTQYRYHESWTQQAAEEKFNRALELADALPALRRSVTRDLRAPGLERATVLAAGIRMLDTGYLRIGSEAYAREHGSIGLATLRCRHVRVEQGIVTLAFRGKSGVPWESRISDADLAPVLERLLSRGPRARLLAWSAGRGYRLVRAADINDDLRARTGGDFTAKDFRTIHGTAIAAAALARAGVQKEERARKQAVVEAVRETAAALGNTPAVARSSYIDPRVLELFDQGRVVELNGRGVESQLREILRDAEWPEHT